MWTISNGDIGLITVKVTSVDRYCVQHGCCATRLTPQSLVASVVLEALVAFVALKPHVASDVLGTLGFPLVALCTLIPGSHSGLGCPGDSENPGNPASPQGYRPLHGFPRQAGQAQAGHPEFQQASKVKICIILPMVRVTITRVSKQGTNWTVYI